jgi:hypothetical protein
MTPQYVQRYKDAMSHEEPTQRFVKFLSYIQMKNPKTDEIPFDGPYEYFPRTMARLGFPPSHLRSLGRKRFLQACKELLLANRFRTLPEQVTYIHAQLTLHFSELRYLPHGLQQNPFARRDVLDRRARKMIKENAQAVMKTIPAAQKSTTPPTASHA